jgi:Prophage tail length tape measure protein
MARRIMVEIIGDASSLEKSFKKASGETENFGKTLGGFAKTAGLALGAAGVGGALAIGKVGWDEYNDSVKITAQTNAVLKSTGQVAGVTAQQVDQLATSLMKKSGTDDEAIKSGENLLLTFTNVQNKAGEGNDIFNQATRTMLDMSTALGQDTSTSAIQLGKALNDPIKGVGALRRVGVSFTEAQKDQIETLVHSGKTMDAQKIILGELTKEFGGSAEMVGKTFPGQLNILHQEFNNWAGDLVAKAIPTIQNLMAELQKHWPEIQKAIQGFWQTVKPILDALVSLLAAAWPIAKKAIETFIPVLQDVGKVLKGVVDVVAGLLSGDWAKAWNGAKDIVEGVLKLVVDLVKGLAERLWTVFNATFGKLFVEPLKNAFAGIKDWLSDHWVQLLVGFFGGIPGLIWVAFQTSWGKEFVDKIEGLAAGLIEAFKNVWTLAAGSFGSATQKASGILGDIQDILISPILDAFGNLPTWIANAVKDGVDAGLAILKSAWNKLFGWLPSWAKKILGIDSPSKVFKGIGENIVDGLIQGFESMQGALLDAAKKLIGRPIDWAGHEIGGIAGKIAGAVTGAVTGGGGAGVPAPVTGAGSEPVEIGRAMAAKYGWTGGQFDALFRLWSGESGWNPNAVNPSSGAAGIPQALGHGHVFNLGDAPAQIAWGLNYIRERYGSPLAAYNAWLSRDPHWYASGGIFTSPSIIGVGEAGPEAVIPLSSHRGLGGTIVHVTVNGDVTGMELVDKVEAEFRRRARRNGPTWSLHS